MNAKVELQKKIKAKLGVTFHPNMSPKGIFEAWGRVPDQIKSVLPVEITTAMTLGQQAVTLEGTLRTTYATAQKVYKECSAAVEAGAAAMIGNTQQPVLLGASKVAKAAESQVDEQVNSLASNLIGKIVDAVPNLP